MTANKAVLAHCNRARVLLGLPRARHLEPGLPCDAKNCVVARTVRVGYEGMVWVYHDGTVEVRDAEGWTQVCPGDEAVAAFIEHFDQGGHANYRKGK